MQDQKPQKKSGTALGNPCKSIGEGGDVFSSPFILPGGKGIKSVWRKKKRKGTSPIQWRRDSKKPVEGDSVFGVVCKKGGRHLPEQCWGRDGGGTSRRKQKKGKRFEILLMGSNGTSNRRTDGGKVTQAVEA